MSKRLLLLGVGNAARAINDCESGYYETKYGTTRQSKKLEQLSEIGLKPILCEKVLSQKKSTGASSSEKLSPETIEVISRAAADAHVVVSFPPNPVDDETLSEAVSNAAKIVYISSTGVYGGASGIIDEDTQVDSNSAATAPRLRAERTWRERGAVILRAPALYGPNYGMHLSLLSGKFRLPGDGSRYSSRIHLEDLAVITLKALRHARRSSVYVVGDQSPVPQIEVVTWLCERLGMDMPPSIPIEEAHITQQGNRQINADRVINDLKVELRFPTYKDGFESCIKAIEASQAH